MLYPISAAIPGPQIPRGRRNLCVRVARPIGVRDDLALEIVVADLRGDIERKTILIDALLAHLSSVEVAAMLLSFELPHSAGVELFADVIDGLPDVAAYRLALVRLDLDDAAIERAVAALDARDDVDLSTAAE